MTSTLNRVEVMEVQELNEYDVYDIEVQGHHNFFAEGVNVHNSADPKPLLHWGRKIRLTAGRAK